MGWTDGCNILNRPRVGQTVARQRNLLSSPCPMRASDGYAPYPYDNVCHQRCSRYVRNLKIGICFPSSSLVVNAEIPSQSHIRTELLEGQQHPVEAPGSGESH